MVPRTDIVGVPTTITVEDAVITRGTVGVFARGISKEPMLVSFSELEVYDLIGVE